KALATGGSAVSVPVSTDRSPAALTLEIEARDVCWVDVSADDVRVVYRLMAPGERQSIAARDNVTMRVGDPSALSLSINGIQGQSLGPPRRPVTVRITPENYRQFGISQVGIR